MGRGRSQKPEQVKDCRQTSNELSAARAPPEPRQSPAVVGPQPPPVSPAVGRSRSPAHPCCCGTVAPGAVGGPAGVPAERCGPASLRTVAKLCDVPGSKMHFRRMTPLRPGWFLLLGPSELSCGFFLNQPAPVSCLVYVLFCCFSSSFPVSLSPGLRALFFPGVLLSLIQRSASKKQSHLSR